ncbi:MAG TPA: deoxyribonuclease IV [Candidatus Dormibacteraeota bacterium]|nr:deoxyribonuclease IV [Candidatus Dormibacteraeota bacterium]
MNRNDLNRSDLNRTEPAYDEDDEYRPEPAPIAQPPAWQDGSFRIGIHTSIAGDIAGSLDIAAKLGANALQIFSASPRMWPGGGTRIADADAVRFRARRAELGLGPLVIHDNYLINLASPERVMRARSIQAFHDELVRAVSLGADFLVAHPGSSLGSEKSQAISEIADGMRQAARGMKFGGLRILVENTSGMGSAIGARFEEIRAILDQTTDLPMGVCLDTAHTFEAGYDIRSEQGLETTLAELDRTVGLNRVYVLHVNDSKTPLGSRVDRHEDIGQGKIGLKAFARILNHPRLGPGPEGLAGRAFILETPIDEPGDDRRNVRALWDMVGVSVRQAPNAEDGFSMAKAKKKVLPQRTQKAQSKKMKKKAVKAGKSKR